MSDLLAAANRFRRELLDRDTRALAEITDAYGLVYQRIRARLDLLLREMEEAKARDESVDQAWLARNGRLQLLRLQVEAEIKSFSAHAEVRIRDAQSEAVRMAAEHAEGLTLTGLDGSGVPTGFTRLPAVALESLVGNLSDGSPLRSLLDELGPDASARTREALVTGVALGYGPRKIAAELREVLGGNLTRALLISRQETIKAYRESGYQAMNANRDVLRGWLWTSSLTTRTCAVCWAMHGTFHPIEERMISHLSCRCVAVPVTKDSSIEVKRGAERLAELPAEKQRLILGEAKYEAYRDRLFKLADLVGVKHNRRWGATLYERSLKDVQKGIRAT